MDDIDDAPREELPVPIGTPLFHITQDGLETLERLLPDLMWKSLPGNWSTEQRVKWGKVQKILSDVRWNGGPPQQVERVE